MHSRQHHSQVTVRSGDCVTVWGGGGKGRGHTARPRPLLPDLHPSPRSSSAPPFLSSGAVFLLLLLLFVFNVCLFFCVCFFFLGALDSLWDEKVHQRVGLPPLQQGSAHSSKAFFVSPKNNTAASASEGESHSESLRTSVSVRACVFVCVCVCYVCVSLYGTAKCVLCASVSCLCLRMSVSGGERQ